MPPRPTHCAAGAPPIRNVPSLHCPVAPAGGATPVFSFFAGAAAWLASIGCGTGAASAGGIVAAVGAGAGAGATVLGGGLPAAAAWITGGVGRCARNAIGRTVLGDGVVFVSGSSVGVTGGAGAGGTAGVCARSGATASAAPIRATPAAKAR